MTKFEKFKLLLENNEFLVATLETIYMTVVSMIFAYLFGLIIGVLLFLIIRYQMEFQLTLIL